MVAKKSQELVEKNYKKYPSSFKILSIDPSFAGLGWVYSEVSLLEKQITILEVGTNTEISKAKKQNKYKLLTEYINKLLTEQLPETEYVICEGQFFKSMYMILGAVAAGIPHGIVFLNNNRKDDRQPKKIRQIVAGKNPIRSKDDVRSFLTENSEKKIDIKDWSHDINDSLMVLLAYLKCNFGLTLENFK